MENHILIGLGGTGGKVLKAFRKRLFEEFTPEERANLPISFLYVDSSTEMMQAGDITWKVLGEDAQFNQNEFLFVKGIDLNTVFSNPSGFPGLKGFIGDPEVMKRTLGEVGAAAAQKRRAGRILFGSNIDSYKQALRAQYRIANSRSGAARTNIHIFTGLAGGTGSGAIIDVIAQTRMMPEFQAGLSPDGKTGTGITAFAMLPEITPPGTCDAGRYHANGFAALTELNALQIKNYQPLDVSGQYERLNLDAVDKVADSCFVYSNINEHGKIVDSLKHLPKMVSDFAFNRIFLEQNDNTEEYNRTYSLENINDWDKERYEKSKTEPADIVRSKRFSSFGIKRIVIPEQEIKEYFAYQFGMQALLQLRFNNWNDDLGFRDTPANIDFHSFVKEAQQWEAWRMTDKHLVLDKPILESDKGKFPPFSEYWGAVIPVWTEQARSARLPLAELSKLCAQGYDQFFRKVGVNSFFEGKNAAREQHALEICSLIEKYMFDKWSTGDYSLYNLCELCDCLLMMMDARRKEMEERITKINQVIDAQEKEKARVEAEWQNLGLLGGLIRKNNLIQGYASIMNMLCMKRTELQGTQFAVSMMGVLIVKMNALRGRVERFVDIINDALNYAEQQIGTRCGDNGTVSLQEDIVRFYNQQGVLNFTETVIKDKTRQKGICDEFRGELLKIIGTERTFARANASISSEEISKLLDTVVMRKAIIIHDEVLLENSEKLINRNILEQLSEKYNTPEALKQFASDVIENSGVYTTFDATQISLAVNNNPIPQKGQNIYRRIVLVNLPEVEGSEQVQKFANKLKAAMIAAVNSDIQVYVDMNGARKNEMTVSSITYCFPLRIVNDLKFFKERYNQLANSPTNSKENRTVLHTEGTGEQFPTLFMTAEKLPSEVRKIYTPYLILGYALGFVKKAQKNDGTGLDAYGTIEKDALDMEVLKPMADSFTGVSYSTEFTEDFGEELKTKFDKAMRGDYLHVNKRQELKTEVQTLIKEVILPECGGNTGSEKFLEFRTAALTALELIANFK